MANLVFYMDYGPLLSRVHKSAFLLYTYYDKFQNDQGVVQFTYNDLYEHLGLATSTIQKSNALLKRCGLIEELAGAGKRYKMLPVKKLTSTLREEILTWTKTSNYNPETSLRKKYLEDSIPAEYQQLLNKKVLKDAYKKLGSLKKPKQLCGHFKIDYHTFKILFERDGQDSFREKFKDLVLQVEQELEPPKKKIKKAIGDAERKVASHLYDKLVEYDAKPIAKNWYIKNCNIAKQMLDSITVEQAIKAIDWGFNDDWWRDKITDLNCLPKLYQRSKLQSKIVAKITRSTPIPEKIIQEIEKQLEVSIQVKTYEDAAFLKQSLLDGQIDDDIVKVVTLLEKSGIIPEGRQNLIFG